MRVDVTVRQPDSECDIALIAPPDTSIGTLRRALWEKTGLSADGQLTVDGAALSDDSLVGELAHGAIITASPARAELPASLRELHIVSGPDAGATFPLSAGTVAIGRDSLCVVRLSDPDVSRRHAELTVRPTDAGIRDLGSTNGSTLDGRPVITGTLVPDSYLRVGDTVLALRSNGTAPTPRSVIEDAAGVIDRPPAPESIRRAPQWMSIVAPLLGGVLFAVLLHNPQFLTFALLSPTIAAGTLLGDRRYSLRKHRRQLTEHARDVAGFDATIASALRDETVMKRARHPDPAAVEHALVNAERWTAPYQATDSDAYLLRVGLADQPSRLQVRDAGASLRPAGTLSLVPVCLDIRGSIGIVGPRPLRLAIARWFIVQTAIRLSPADVRVCLPSDPEKSEDWDWARWLPHVHDRSPATHATLVIDGGVANRPDDSTGVLCLADNADQLPLRCDVVVGPAGAAGSRVRVTGSASVEEVIADLPGAAWTDRVARRLSAVVASAEVGGVPQSCTLSDVVGGRHQGATDIAAAWSVADGSASTALGMHASGPLVVDLARDGPHALIAGTTGSGKSELLQTLVVGLAAAHPPDELSFVLVDYKGGAAFGDCAVLPHVSGLLTDLDSADTARALASLNAEIVRRERSFARFGARDLGSFRAVAGHNAIARLVLVVDEFATMIDELPDFVAGLVDVARRGRSLGIHLVLATQRPGGVISPEIRANTSLRIALRTADEIESIDVVGTAAAAHFSAATPGRAAVRTGSEIVEMQVASVSGPPPDHTPRVELLGPSRSLRRRERAPDAETQLSLLVTAIATAAQDTGRSAAVPPWLPPLPTVLAPWPTQPTRIPFALVDSPSEQGQDRIELDVARGGAVLVAGAAGSGRTSTLLAAAAQAAQRLDTERLRIHAVDAAGGGLDPVARLPHCATAIDGTDLTAVARLVEQLTMPAAVEEPARHHLVLIDGWDALAAASDVFDVGRTADAVLRLLRSASSGLVLAIVAGDRNLLYPRVTSTASELVILRLHESVDYALAGVSPRAVPAWMPPGRGLRRDGRVLQLVAIEPQIAPPMSSVGPMCG